MASKNHMIPTPTMPGAQQQELMYRGAAMSCLQRLKDANRHLNAYSGRYQLPDGAVVVCNVCYNHESVQVLLPSKPVVLSKDDYAETPQFLCQPRFCDEFAEGYAEVLPGYYIAYKYVGYNGYDLKREEVVGPEYAYPWQDGDHATSMLKAAADGGRCSLQPTEFEDYGNVDWQGDNGTVTWKGAHSRYGTQYQVSVGGLYQPVYSSRCYIGGKGQKPLPLRFVLPDDYAGGQIDDVVALPLVFDEINFTYLDLMVFGAAVVKDGESKWLINIGCTPHYVGVFVLGLQLTPGADGFLCVDDDGAPVWMLAGYHHKLVNTSWFFNSSGTQAVSTETWIINHLTISFAGHMPLAAFTEEDTKSVSNSESYSQTSKTAHETSRGVFAADWKGDTLVKAEVVQTFDADERNTYDQSDDHDYTGVDAYAVITLHQTSPQTDYTCTTVLHTGIQAVELQRLEYYYALEHNSYSAWKYVGYEEYHAATYECTHRSEQGTASQSSQKFAVVLFMDLRHDVVVVTERTRSHDRSFSGYTASGDWITLITPYTPPGVIDIQYDQTYGGDLHDSGHKTTVYKAGQPLHTVEGGQFLGMLLFTAILSTQGTWFNPRMPQPDLIFTGEINAYLSNHPVGSFACKKDDYFYSFLIHDTVLNGTTFGSPENTLYRHTYDVNGGKDAQHKVYYPVAPC